MNEEATLTAMHRFGGNFVQLLATLYRAADCSNKERLSVAFADLFDKYRKMAADVDRSLGDAK
jgi:hypothetical protein